MKDRIAKARRDKGWTQTQLAEAVGVKQTTISRLESGETNLTVEMAERLCAALGISVALGLNPTDSTRQE